MLENSAPVIVAMWLVYCTIDWYSVPRSSLSRAMTFRHRALVSCLYPYPGAGGLHAEKGGTGQDDGGGTRHGSGQREPALVGHFV
jgi:hypothetical protein